MTDVGKIKKDFPIFDHHPDLVYLDTASTAHMSKIVIDAICAFEEQSRANIHRGVYALSEKATQAYEGARKIVADFIGAASEEVVFTSGTTFGLNMLAQTLSRELKPGDNVVLTRMEHHANLVPWMEMAKRYGFEVRCIELKDFALDRISATKVIDEKTKIVSVAHVSNVLGTVNPIKEIVEKAKAVGAITIIDAAQSVAHLPIDVRDLDCDFLVFSGHKMYGPTGIGVLYGKKERLVSLPPFLFGGDMVREVSYENATWMGAPQKFEAGTPNIAGAIGLGAAVEYIQNIGWEKIQMHEQELRQYAWNRLKSLPGVVLLGMETGIGVISFTVDGIHPHDVATILDTRNVAVRAGHHCAMPLMGHLGINGTVRASFSVYNAAGDIDRLVEGLHDASKIFLK